MREIDVRNALINHDKAFRRFHRDPGTRIIQELGLCQGDARIDVAVINGKLHGYEIKSQRDNLDRLPRQIEIYSKVFDKITLVVDQSHIDAATSMVPSWWGIKRVFNGPRSVQIQNERPALDNPTQDPYAICQLLWKEEATAILDRYGLLRGIKGKPRSVLWSVMVENVPLSTINAEVRATLKARLDWRVGSSKKLRADSPRQKPKSPNYLSIPIDWHMPL